MVRQRRFSTGKVNAEWGYPGGLLDEGETIKNGAEREVYEETGVKGEF